MFFTLYFLFARVTSSSLRLYNCKEIEGVHYLVADFSIECYTPRWHAYAAANSVFLLLYHVGIPALFFWLMKRCAQLACST